ncbi:MAG TPA: energy transducer TonB [Bacteroidia bacterium]|nr:energy transducer TonB [Bacteroidia bacterium]
MILPVRKLFPVAAVFAFLLFSCKPDDPAPQFTDSTDGSSPGVDTFVVSRSHALSPADQQEIDKDTQETRQIVNDAVTLINGGQAPSSSNVNDDDIVIAPDDPPTFPGGQDAMDEYIHRKLVYPLTAMQNDIKGTVTLKVVIEKDGQVGAISIVRGLGYGCDEAAVECVRGMPKWIPAKKAGYNVRTTVTIPLYFAKDDD